MSELKAYIAPTPDGTGLADYYLKSEADKEINLWKNEAHKHYENWFNLNKQFEGWFGKVMRCERAERELRRQKYKRCLAMAKWCASDCVVNQNTYKRFLTRKSEFRIDHFHKWYKRWLELAEKFKEAK